MSRAHAILSPSGAAKWLNCTPSARLEQSFPDREGDAAREGTLAHSVAELILALRLQRISIKKYREQLAILEQSEFYNKAMYEYCEQYALYVLEQFAAAQATTPDAKLFIEQTFDISQYAPECFGHIDLSIIANKVLDIIDFKFGKGVAVSAEENPQLSLYGLGALEEYAHLYDIETVRMTIHQPRLDNISVWSIPAEDLRRWGNGWVKPSAKLAFAGEGELRAGAHCKFCKAKPTCKANAALQLETVGADFASLETLSLDGQSPNIMTDDQVSKVIQRASDFTNWIESVKEYALAQALAGKKWPGYKLVAGKAFRKITDVPAVEKLLIKEGFDRTKLYKPQELIAMTEIEKMTGKKFFDEKITPYVTKTNGAPTLALQTDKRPEYASADKDFDELG